MKEYVDQTYYEILEISPSASHEEIQHAYHKAKSIYNPESAALYSMFSQEETRQISALIDEAYSVLSNIAKRRDYDLQLDKGKTTSSNIATPKAPKNTDTTKDGFGLTRFGQYLLKPEFEQEIRSQDFFDGSFLQKIREYKQVSIEQISEVSRIGKHHLRALENNDFENLPALVFIRGFVKQYCELLELDVDKISDSYMKLCKDSREK